MDTKLGKPDRAAWIMGSAAQCSVLPTPKHALRMVLLGPPGVGKGTQAELLCDLLGVCHLSTGDIFRFARQSCECWSGSAMASAVQCMQRGELVPDQTVLDIIRQRSGCLKCRGGFLLDGFPRTLAQAQVLESLLRDQDLLLDAVVDYQLPMEQIVARLSGRRVCSGCKAVFHITDRPPLVPDVCDHCGKALFQREDDRPESMHVRKQAYLDTSSPLIQFYEQRGLLVTVSADGAPEQILGRTIMTLAALQGPMARRLRSVMNRLTV